MSIHEAMKVRYLFFLNRIIRSSIVYKKYKFKESLLIRFVKFNTIVYISILLCANISKV